jgi:hypothetical protein
MKLFLDLESTGLLGQTASEPITGFFALYDEDQFVDSYELFVKPERWEKEAETIHKIPIHVAMSYPSKSLALQRFDNWITEKVGQNNLNIWCYVNQLHNTWFDMSVIRLWYLDCGRLFDYYKHFNCNYFHSVRDLVKEAASKQLIKPPINPETGRARLDQESVYKSLFEGNYEAHTAKGDVMAMIKIYNHLNTMLKQDKVFL